MAETPKKVREKLLRRDLEPRKILGKAAYGAEGIMKPVVVDEPQKKGTIKVR